MDGLTDAKPGDMKHKTQTTTGIRKITEDATIMSVNVINVSD